MSTTLAAGMIDTLDPDTRSKSGGHFALGDAVSALKRRRNILIYAARVELWKEPVATVPSAGRLKEAPNCVDVPIVSLFLFRWHAICSYFCTGTSLDRFVGGLNEGLYGLGMVRFVVFSRI